MTGGQRSPKNLPPADIFGCAVASFAANHGIPSTFTSKGEPLGKYKFRQMANELLPTQYRTDRAYFNCINMEATVFWISYIVNFQRFPTLDAKKLVNAPKMSAHHRGICHF